MARYAVLGAGIPWRPSASCRVSFSTLYPSSPPTLATQLSAVPRFRGLLCSRSRLGPLWHSLSPCKLLEPAFSWALLQVSCVLPCSWFAAALLPAYGLCWCASVSEASMALQSSRVRLWLPSACLASCP
jgi:hypothetical protein